MPQSSRFRSARTIAVLAITQITSWGTSFDMLGVMGRIVAPDLGLPNEIVFGGLTIMMLVSAVVGPTTGRLLVKHGAAKVLACGSLLFALGLALLAAAHGPFVYFAAWLIIGIAGSFGLSAPAYTAVVEREGLDGKRAIAILMLFTGLSVTVFWPLLTYLTDLIGWRETFVVCAGVHLFICLPLHLFGLPPRVESAERAKADEIEPVQLTPEQKKRAFFYLAAVITISALVSYGLAPSLITILIQSGAAPALALQLGAARGAFGVSARVVDMTLGRRGNALITSLIGLSLMLCGFLIAATLAPATAALVTFMVLYGFGSGVVGVARALLPLTLFSAKDFGMQSARLTLPQNLATAASPVVFTAILDRLGGQYLLILSAVLILAALTFVLLLTRLVKSANATSAEAHSVTARSRISAR
ncbi:MFS transporter [Neorhizobium alkalisoli]|uniref:Putative MFS family arabinose efflux permease n=1 Tax=Neorhizobium alkalisoli TaxID=528178 RepID=A0A561R318_9HYPH|nr:MFS transporter [Neorhizobium alkalisoli]TWF57002.1 putative MFS family arabinose efflux permease [Neorhizobium alkalisoli]